MHNNIVQNKIPADSCVSHVQRYASELRLYILLTDFTSSPFKRKLLFACWLNIKLWLLCHTGVVHVLLPIFGTNFQFTYMILNFVVEWYVCSEGPGLSSRNRYSESGFFVVFSQSFQANYWVLSSEGCDHFVLYDSQVFICNHHLAWLDVTVVTCNYVTPWSRVAWEVIYQLSSKQGPPACCGTRRFFIVFTRIPPVICILNYEGMPISKLQMDIELKQIGILIWKILLFLSTVSLYIEALVPSFHKPLKTSSIKFFGLLSKPGGDFPFYSFIVGKNVQPKDDGSRLKQGQGYMEDARGLPTWNFAASHFLSSETLSPLRRQTA
jgi:hypothetical protein